MKINSIAIFIWGLAGDAIANNASAMAKGFLDLGIKDVYLIYLFAEPGRNVAVPEGSKLVALGAKRSRWAPLLLSRFLREERPEFLISMPTIINVPATLGWLLSGKGRTKFIISEHSTMSYKAYVEYKDDWRMRTLPWVARFLYPMASGLRANSEDVLDDLLNKIRIPMDRKRTITITNPVNVEAIAQHSLSPSSHPWLGHRHVPVILSVARLAKQKNFPLLLQAFGKVRQVMDAKLIILGEGPERPYLEALTSQLGLSEHVSLPGFSDNPWSSMAKADVFVLPSEEEPFGLVLVEAMACGVPVIATDALGGGPRKIIGDSQHGILVPSDQPSMLTDTMLDLLCSPEKRAFLIDAGKQRCQAFKPQVVAQEWLSFLEHIDALTS
ncbi:MAG: glycosyltransferase [Cyanothece sp. SIO1E1]|nr:glycosyltransferase [Cyanothece sp. SIO1E1]